MIELFAKKNSKEVQINESKVINSEGRLSINDNDEEKVIIENNNSKLTYSSKNKHKKCHIPFIVYILIFTFILLIISIILLIRALNTYEIYYIYEKDIYIKPNISEHNYSKISFNNGLQIVLTQVSFDDIAGGAISFERGYLDKKYEPGLLNLAFLSLRFNDIESSRYLKDYMGSLTQAPEEFYSTVYFTIINSGFQKYLSNFTMNISYIEENFTEHVENNLKKMNLYNFSSVKQREKYLIEYLVYDIKDEDGKDINRQGEGNEIKERLKGDYSKIKDIMNELFEPKKVKLIFFTHYKMSLMKKIILRSLKDLTKKDSTLNETEIYYENINTNKIIFHYIDKHENNYIKINYYIKNKNANLSQLYKDSGYFNYIKYILNETNENSLYYNLTHPKDNSNGINIKSLFCDFEVVLKNKIRFTILINLNSYSYKHIKEIIQIIYTYMEKIKLHINNIKLKDERASELYFINEQNFTFTEDVHKGEFYKNKAKDLFYRDDKDYYLREVWIPSDLDRRDTNITFYSEQLTLNNSVVIIGLSNDTINKYNINENKSDISFIFQNITQTNFSSIFYSINNLDKLNINVNDINNFTELIFYKNDFISKYTCDNIMLSKEENQNERNFSLIDGSNDLIKFYWLKNTNFKLPKVFFVYYFFHPFLRPNSTESKHKNIIFYHLMLYLSYIQRQIDSKLSDAIRAGTIFKFGYRENYIYLDVFTYSDILEKIIKIIKEIIISIEYNTLKKNYDIYKDYAVENLLNFNNENKNNTLKYEFYTHITTGNSNLPPIYNFYLFPQGYFLNFTEIDKNYINNIIFPLVKVFIFGYYDKNETEKLFNLHKNIFTKTHFYSTLNLAEYNPSDPSVIDGDKFTSYVTTRQKNLTETKIFNKTTCITDNKKYVFMNFVEFSDNNRIPVEIFRRIIQDFDKNGTRVEVTNQKIIYLTISFNKSEETKEIKKNLITTVNNSKKEMMEPLDVIGGRFYYLIRNLENEYTKTPNNMEDAILALTYNQIYNRTSVYDYKIDPDNYDEFINTIKLFFDNNENYCEFSNQ